MVYFNPIAFQSYILNGTKNRAFFSLRLKFVTYSVCIVLAYDQVTSIRDIPPDKIPIVSSEEDNKL